jgi:RNA polymerase sporulation-specific sigma factor
VQYSRSAQPFPACVVNSFVTAVIDDSQLGSAATAPLLERLDEDALVARALAGDELALATLLRRYRPFVRAKARPFFLRGAERQDVVQEGLIGLYKAIRDYDPTREASFRSFAELCITRQIISAIKSAARHKHSPLNTSVSLHLPAFEDSDGEEELAAQIVSQLPDPAESAVATSELDKLRRYCSAVLSELEAEVLQRYVDGESYAEIAAVLNRHVKAVDNALQRVKRKLEPFLAGRALDEAV